MWFLLLISCVGRDEAAAHPLRIVDASLAWTPSRERLTSDYALRHTGRAITRITPRMVILHGTPETRIDDLRARFGPPELSAERGDLRWASSLNIATHYAVDRDGTVYRFLPDDRYARHAVGFNHLAIGIEHLGDGPQHPLTPAQVAATVTLVRQLDTAHAIDWLQGHHELVPGDGHPMFVEMDADYRTLALDPGDDFVRSVRDQLADLNLQGEPLYPSPVPTEP